MKKIIIIVVAVVLLLLIGVGAMLFLMGGKSSVSDEELTGDDDASEEVSEVMQEPFYLEIRPPFVVTLIDGDKSYFLQVETAILSYTQEDNDAIEKNQPAIKSALVDLYSQQEVSYMKTREGKDELKTAALESVKQVMKKFYGKEAAKDIFFTKFVLQ